MAFPQLQAPPPPPSIVPMAIPARARAPRGKAGGVVGDMHATIVDRLGLPKEAFTDESDAVERFVSTTSRVTGYAAIIAAVAGIFALIF
jgi:hypothetical protein